MKSASANFVSVPVRYRLGLRLGPVLRALGGRLREHGEAIYGLDCMPREDLRKISARDRHAAHKIAEIRERHPRAVVLVLFGKSHLAPAHLPREIRKQLPNERVLTVLQNVDALYLAGRWRTGISRARRQS